MKLCHTCDQTKPFEEFYADKRYSDGYSWRCRACTKAAAIKSHKENPERTRANSKRWRKKMKDHLPDYARRLKYGLPLGEFEVMVTRQGGMCAICKVTPEKGLVVDHCHKSGKVRALLCSHCNAGLGSFRENLGLLDAAKGYLLTHTETTA